jgi:integrase
MPSFVSEFMLNLHKQLMDDKKVSEPTATKYLQNLTTLNEGKPFKNLSFLKKFDSIDSKLKELAKSTRLAYYATLTSVLSLFKDKPTYKKTYLHYSSKMNDGIEERKSEDPHEKTEKMEKNWMPWKDIQDKREKLKEEVEKFGSSKSITAENWDTLLKYVILSLYTEIPARRNQDFMEMYVVASYNDTLPNDKNYLDLKNKKFYFNKYKTSKKYGQQVVDINDSLMDAINHYLVRHPNYKKRMTKNSMFRFLVKHDGSPLNSANGITRILNKIFGKRVGSSMIRHLYLSDKYGDTLKEMERDASIMSHSTAQQKEYIKTEDHKAPKLVISE